MIVGSNLHGPFPAKAEEALWYEWLSLERPENSAVPTEGTRWALLLQTNLRESIDEESE